LTAFAPERPTREGPVRVALDGDGPAGGTRLPGGGVGPTTARTGPDGRLRAAWTGVSGTVRSVDAVCAFEPTDGGDGEPFSATVSGSVAGGRGVL
jgi:hypothetical protein